MGLETLLKAYLMLFWPETGPLSKTTVLDLRMAAVRFDESVPEVGRKLETFYEGIGTAQVKKPADYAESHRMEMYAFCWSMLEKATAIKRDRNIGRVFFFRVPHQGEADRIAKAIPVLLYNKYMKGDTDLRYLALSKGSSVSN